jgi:hypothetical protein
MWRTPVHTDELFGRDVGHRLRTEQEDIRAAEDLVVAGVRGRLARRAWRIRGAVAASVVVCLAALLAVVVIRPPATDSHPTAVRSPSPTSGASQPPLLDIADVVNRTEASLRLAANDIRIDSESLGPEDHFDMWLDPVTLRYRLDRHYPLTASPGPVVTTPGYPVAPPYSAPTGPVVMLSSAAGQYTSRGDIRYQCEVDYVWKTYQCTGFIKIPPEPNSIDIFNATSVRAAVSSGRGQVLGRETVDGRDTLHLRFVNTPDPIAVTDVWVESTTFLPVQDCFYRDGLIMPAEDAIRETYTWLPRTAENLAWLTLTPPPGFKHLP